MSSKLIRWLAYLGGWTLFALFFISEDPGDQLYQGRTVDHLFVAKRLDPLRYTGFRWGANL